MKTQLVLSFFLLFSALSVFGQKTLQVSKENDISGEIFRGIENNEAVVRIISFVHLKFESNMDNNQAIVYKVDTANYPYMYFLKFSPGRRLLTIKSYGFKETEKKLELKAGDRIELVVSNPDDNMACYYMHWNKGNEYFQAMQYIDAKMEYYIAQKCNDAPADNNLDKKIKIANDCQNFKSTADNYYIEGKYEEAYDEYKKLDMWSDNNAYAKKQMEICKNKAKEKEKALAEQKEKEGKASVEQKEKQGKIPADYIIKKQKSTVRNEKLANQNLDGHYITWGSSLLSSGYYGIGGLGYEYRHNIFGINFSIGGGFDFLFFSNVRYSYWNRTYINANAGLKLYLDDKAKFARSLYFNFLPFCYFGQGEREYSNLFGIGLFLGYSPVWHVRGKVSFGFNIDVGIKSNFNKSYFFNWDCGLILKFDNKTMK